MFLSHSLEEKIKQNEKKIKELELQHEALSREVNHFFRDLQFTPEQIDQILNNPANFTPEAWDELQKHRNEIEAKLDSKLKAINDPRAAQKNHASRNLPHYALFVR